MVEDVGFVLGCLSDSRESCGAMGGRILDRVPPRRVFNRVNGCGQDARAPNSVATNLGQARIEEVGQSHLDIGTL